MNRIGNLRPFVQPFFNKGVQDFSRFENIVSRSLKTKSYRKLSSEEVFWLSDKYVTPNYAHLIPFNEQAHNSSLPSRAYYNDILPQVAKKLDEWYQPILRMTPEDTIQFMPKNTGGEACDAAIKLMREAGRHLKGIKDGDQLIVVFNDNLHRRPMSVISASDDPIMKDSFGPLLPGFIFCDFNDTEQLEAIFEKHGKRICGAMVEYVQREAGVHIAKPEFISTLRNLTIHHQAMLVADDVQAGWGRTGKLSPSEHYANGSPDAIVFAKSCTAGTNPAAGLVARESWIEMMSPGAEGPTSAVNPKSMAAMLATMDYYEEIDLFPKLAEIAVKLQFELLQLQEQNHSMHEVRGAGAMIAVEWDTPEDGAYYQKKLLDNGIALKLTQGERTMRFNPPLLTEKELDDAIDIIRKTFTT